MPTSVHQTPGTTPGRQRSLGDTDCQPATDQQSVLHTSAHYSSPTQLLSMTWIQQGPGNSPSKLLIYTAPLSVKRSAALTRANPCQQASGSENDPGDI